MPLAPHAESSPEFEHSLLINAAPTRVLAAFLDPRALEWWGRAARAVTTPRAMGVFAVEWPPTPDADDLLGRLGGVFLGRAIEDPPGRERVVADAWWLPPDGDPIGPMGLTITCAMDGPACRLTVKQGGFEEKPRRPRHLHV